MREIATFPPLKTFFLFSLALLATLPLSGCSEKPAVDVWGINEACNLHSGQCSNQQNGASVSLSISPNQPIPIAQQLQVNVTIKGIQAKKVQLDITGTNMYMGYNRIDLTKDSNQKFSGKALLAFCTNSSMEWLLSVMILDNKGHIHQVPFRLITQNKHITPKQASKP